MEKRICLYCKNEFEAEETSKIRFCSKEHQYNYSHEKAAETLGKEFTFSTKRKCLNCGKEFIPTTGSKVKTCSRKCGYEYRSKNQISSRKPLVCIICGKEFEDKNYTKNKTCSIDCALELRKRTNVQLYGVSNAMQNESIKDQLRKNNIRKIGVATYAESLIPKEIRSILSSKEKLEDLYIKQDLTIAEIAQQLQVSDFCIGQHLKKYNIPIREWKKSHMQKRLVEWLISLGFNPIVESKLIIPSKKEIDIYIDKNRVAIEFDGLFWHSEQYLKKERKQNPIQYHLNKTKECEERGIHLIHIYEDDWVNKQEIVKNRLRSILGLISSQDKIFARKCISKEISHEETVSFLQQYHLYGNNSSSVNFGLFYRDDLVSVMTFGNLRKALGQSPEANTYELLRFASKNKIVGGASKLFKFFIEKYRPKKVISYADRDWTTDIFPNLYDKLGFIKISNGHPGYWYIINGHREHRYNWRKSELPKKLEVFDSNKSEYQNMLANGYDRIWGCGSFKYEWISSIGN